MDDKVSWATMARMLNLRNVFKLVNDRFNDGAFAHQKFIRQMHQTILHVFAQASDEMQPMLKEQFAQRSRDVAAIADEFTSQMVHHLRDRSPVINIAGSQAACEQFPLIIDCQVQSSTQRTSPSGIPRALHQLL